MDIIQIILLAVVTFIFAIDQFSLTETLYRPIISCTIIGAILGNMEIGLLVGGTYEIMVIGNMPVGGAQPPNVIIAGVAGCILAIKANMEVNAALGACMIFATFGQYVVTVMFTIMSGLMAKADKAAAEANPKGITAVLNISMAGLGGLFALIAIVAYSAGVGMSDTLTEISKNASWFMGGLGAAGGMMRFVGFAILLKIMLSNDLWGYLLAGFAFALILGNIPATSSAALILVAFIGIAIALNDFLTTSKIKENAGSGMGGMSDGI